MTPQIPSADAEPDLDRRATPPEKAHELLVIVGATGTGKSDLSLDLAEALARRGTPAQIINADAMQLYRGMNIGTAKLAVSERRGIAHHLLDVLHPTEEANVASYQSDARSIIRQIQGAGEVPILVGGSGLYVSSVIHDFQFPARDPQVRATLEAELELLGAGALFQRLRERDPEAAQSIGPQNVRRIVRALEVIEITGKPFGAGLSAEHKAWTPHRIIGLRAPREKLVARLDERAQAMWSAGLLAEVRELRLSGFGVTAARAIGYAQAIAQLDGVLCEDEAIQQTAALTRRYARRQVGWFKRYGRCHWLEFDDPDRLSGALAVSVGENGNYGNA